MSVGVTTGQKPTKQTQFDFLLFMPFSRILTRLKPFFGLNSRNSETLASQMPSIMILKNYS
jgi:hypothetical protein